MNEAMNCTFPGWTGKFLSFSSLLWNHNMENTIGTNKSCLLTKIVLISAKKKKKKSQCTEKCSIGY